MEDFSRKESWADVGAGWMWGMESRSNSEVESELGTGAMLLRMGFGSWANLTTSRSLSVPTGKMDS